MGSGLCLWTEKDFMYLSVVSSLAIWEDVIKGQNGSVQIAAKMKSD